MAPFAGPCPDRGRLPVDPRRLGAAAAVAIALHIGLLSLRPGALANSEAGVPARALSVRMLPESRSPVESASGGEAADASPRSPASTRTPARPALADAATRPPPRQRRGDGLPQSGATTAQRVGAPTGLELVPPLGHSVAPALPKAGEALPAAPDYAFGVRLDPGPRPLHDIEPEYPESGHLREGTVVLRLLISETGHVDNVAVVRAEPRDVFDRAALDAFSKARFSPGLAAGTPVKSQITVEVSFVPINRGGRVSGRTY